MLLLCLKLGEHREPGQLTDDLVAAADHLPEHRLLPQQGSAHAEPLRALAGKDKDHLGRLPGRDLTVAQTGSRLAARVGGQQRGHLARGPADACQAMLVLHPTNAGGISNIVQRLGGPAQILRIGLGHRQQGLVTLG